jgi:hypothetical protein
MEGILNGYKFEVHYIWYKRKSYNTGPEQGHINCLLYILIYEILINLVVTDTKPFMFCVEKWQLKKVPKSGWKRICSKDLLEIQDKTVMEAHPQRCWKQ